MSSDGDGSYVWVSGRWFGYSYQCISTTKLAPQHFLTRASVYVQNLLDSVITSKGFRNKSHGVKMLGSFVRAIMQMQMPIGARGKPPASTLGIAASSRRRSFNLGSRPQPYIPTMPVHLGGLPMDND